MPWCPKCGAEYRDGFTECSECHIPLVQQYADVDKPDEICRTINIPVRVYTASSLLEAETISDMLRSNEIPVLDRPAAFSQIQAYSGADARFGIELLVDKTQADQASKLISEVKQLSSSPFDENELSRLAEEQALKTPVQEPDDNLSFSLLPRIISVIAVLLILLYFVARA